MFGDQNIHIDTELFFGEYLLLYIPVQRYFDSWIYSFTLKY